VNAHANRGITLIETVMALAASLVLMGGVMVMFQALRQSENATRAATGVIEIQETIRRVYSGRAYWGTWQDSEAVIPLRYRDALPGSVKLDDGSKGQFAFVPPGEQFLLTLSNLTPQTCLRLIPAVAPRMYTIDRTSAPAMTLFMAREGSEPTPLQVQAFCASETPLTVRLFSI
jgi:hypothetical protein